MRLTLSILVLSILLVGCKNEAPERVKPDGYLVEGTAPGVYNGIRAYLETTTNRGRKVAMDTAIVMNEKFVFEGRIGFPQMVSLRINSVNGSLPMILENDIITIDVDNTNIKNSAISGTDANFALNQFNSQMDSLRSIRTVVTRKLRSASREGSNVDTQDLQRQVSEVDAAMKELPFEFIENNKDNMFSVILLDDVSKDKNVDFQRLDKTFNSLNEELKSSITGEKLKSDLALKRAENVAAQATQIGSVAPEFSAPDVDGKPLALSDVKGKLTLIDFWASWCKPCRRENPNVVKVYNKYHSKGLEIISVSLDGTRTQKDPKAAWLKAIEDDKLTWHHVSNLKYFNDPVARTYNIRSIPATFLLDENGKIVAKNLRGDALEKKVAEFLN